MFYSCFDESKQQKIIEQWIPLNRNKNIVFFEEILNSINYQIPNSNQFANKLLNSAISSSNIDEKEKMYDLFFNIRVSNDYDYATYSNQIISNICSNDLNYQNFGLKQIEKHSKRINEYNLNENTKKTLLKTYLPNVNQYHNHIKNYMTSSFGINKKAFNNEIRDNKAIRDLLVDYLVNTGDSDLFGLIKPILFQNNYISFVKDFLNKAGNQIQHNKNLIDKYRVILELLMTKYFKDYANNLKSFIDEYNYNLNTEKDQIILALENKLKYL